MINKLLFKLSGRLPFRSITRDDGEPYLERYYVGQLFGVTFYLHRFVSSDEEPHLHNHPWKRGRALVLSGGYDEEVVVDLCPALGGSGCITKTQRIRWWNVVNGNTFHRISAASPGTWTLFMHGARQTIPARHDNDPNPPQGLKGWGFLQASMFREYTSFVPFVSSNTVRWWVTAPIGAEANRVPL